MTLATLDAILGALGARMQIRVDWNGEAVDRLLDADHAAIVEFVVAELRRAGWEPVPEVSFAIDGERGSIDILGWHAASGTLLVVEVKSVVPDVQATLFAFDRKQRLADRIARDRGWRPGRIASLLVIAEGRTSRRRIEAHASTFDVRFPDRAVAIRRFIANPAAAEGLRGLWFVPGRTGANSRQRVVKRRAAA